METGNGPAAGRAMGNAAWLRALEATARIAGEPRRTLPVVMDELGARLGERPAVLSVDESFTFAGLAGRARRYARWALASGIRPGDRVGLLMPNRPEYLAIWLGITRAGGTVALLNTSLSGGSLAHAIDAARPRHVIVAAGLEPTFAGAAALLRQPTRAWLHGATAAASPLPRIDRVIEDISDAPLTHGDLPDMQLSDTALLIYTSGTTGMPKAANVSHRRIMSWTHWFAGLLGMDTSDRLYNCLPMFHSIGGVVAMGAPLVAGGSVLVRDGFSASRFWDEVAANDCTLFQYIGELCRYLLVTPECEAERRHRLRACLGNGLGAAVWQPFQERFAIPHVVEFYAATEGTFSLSNVDGKVGSIGRLPAILRRRPPIEIVRHDPDAVAPWRGNDGRCARCGVDEPGEAIGRMDGDGSRFEGYTSAEDTAAKVLRDVLEPGDAWFRTGDLMRRDAAGFYHFVDRVGDTFRWKGENVSTLEVAGAVRSAPGVRDAVVYGVKVPGAEGRAGMAAIVPGDGFDPARLGAHLAATLPAYARPLFLRVCETIATTATYKPRTADLAREGFDPGRITDPLWLDRPGDGRPVPVDAALYAAISAGRTRL